MGLIVPRLLRLARLRPIPSRQDQEALWRLKVEYIGGEARLMRRHRSLPPRGWRPDLGPTLFSARSAHCHTVASTVSRLLIVTGCMLFSLAAGGGQRRAGLTDRPPGHVERCGGGSCRPISWRGRTGRPRADRVQWLAAPMREGAGVEAPDRVPAQPVHALEDQTGGQVPGR
jgi:hypothetical protein